MWLAFELAEQPPKQFLIFMTNTHFIIRTAYNLLYIDALFIDFYSLNIRHKSCGSGGIRTHASGETGALNQRLRPLGHATRLTEGAQRTARILMSQSETKNIYIYLWKLACGHTANETTNSWLESDSRCHGKRYMEVPGIEPGASYMQSKRSTAELHPHRVWW